jgi:phage major head subunit gpT-like protein
MATPVYAPQMLRKDVRGEFIEAQMNPRPPLLIERISTIMTSTSDRENYAWLSEPYEMEEFVDGMPIHPLTDTGETAQTGSKNPGYEIVNKTYAGALVFKRDDLADDKVGGYRQRIQDAATQAVCLPDSLLIDKLVAGTTDTCYLQVGATGEAFFSATHAIRGKQTSTWSNLLTGTGTTVAQCTTDIGSALTSLYTRRNEANVLMNRNYRQVFVLAPQALEVTLRTAIYAAIVSSTSNVGFAPAIELITEPMLDATSSVDYYVGFLDCPLRGLIWQSREGVMLEEVGEGSEMWTNLRQIEYATTLRGAPGFGRPQRLLKIDNT